jgi:hypothetical protein
MNFRDLSEIAPNLDDSDFHPPVPGFMQNNEGIFLSNHVV